MTQELTEILDMIDTDYLLDELGVDYKSTFGSSGRQLNVKECPECGNSKWKVYLNEETGAGNCFRCDAKYSKFSFARAALSLSGRETFEYLKGVAEVIGWRPKRVPLKDVNEAPGDLVLPDSAAIPIQGCNLTYLDQRRIDIDTAEYFRLRFCFSGYFYYQWNGERAKQDYANRVIVPIYDLEGKLVSFQGRDITGAAGGKKYLFPPGFASTGRYLYNGHNAIGADRVVVGEGVFDVMSLKVAMDEDPALRDIVPIGTFGKSLSAGDGEVQDQLGQFLILKQRGLREVTFVWDSERTAITAAVDAGERLRALGLRVRIAILPAGKDPNECIPEEVRTAYRRAVTLNKMSAIKLRVSHS